MFRLFFKELLGLEVKLTSDVAELTTWSGAKISYAQQAVSDELFFYSRQLLFESGIREQNISVFEWEGHPVFFATGKSSALPFDPFAAAFFLVSRYEEYLPHIRDSLDRFDAHQSLAWQHNFLHVPVVEKWAILLRDLLQQRFPELSFPARSYNYIPSLDIDNAWAYREKGFMRVIGGYLKDLIAVNVVEVKKRTRVLLGFEKDPYDTYSYQLDLQKKYALKPLYFFLVADYGVNDKNVPVQNRRFRDLIRHIADYADVGVHPSFGSNREPERLRVEIGRLRTIIHRDITKSRQHFLMLKFPETYRNLMERDITDDYSMGYANEIGFRASISSAFNFYDLDQEIETTLRIHPFGVMDATLNYYMKLNPDEAVERVRLLIDEVRQVNGTFMTLWHNETLSDEKQWKGWRHVYDRIVEEAHVPL